MFIKDRLPIKFLLMGNYFSISQSITKYTIICIFQFHSPWFSQQWWNMHLNLKVTFPGVSVLYLTDTWRNGNSMIMRKGHFDLHYYYGLRWYFTLYNTLLPVLAINHASFLQKYRYLYCVALGFVLAPECLAHYWQKRFSTTSEFMWLGWIGNSWQYSWHKYINSLRQYNRSL